LWCTLDYFLKKLNEAMLANQVEGSPPQAVVGAQIQAMGFQFIIFLAVLLLLLCIQGLFICPSDQ
jgi:hypothetical protein